MTNIIKFNAALPLFTRNLRCPHLSYKGQKVPHTKGFKAQWFHCAAAAEQRKLMPCQARTTWQGQAPLKLCRVRYAPNKCQSRTFLSKFRRKSKTALEFKKADNVDSHYELIYRVSDGGQYVKLGIGGLDILAASVITNIAVIACGVPLNYIDVALASPIETGTFLTVNFLICFALFKVIRWYPLRIYYSELEDQFLAVFVGIHPFAIYALKIQPGEVKPVPPSKITGNVLPWTSDLYSTSSQRMFLYIHHFRYPLYYNKLLGYI